MSNKLLRALMRFGAVCFMCGIPRDGKGLSVFVGAVILAAISFWLMRAAEEIEP